MLGISFPCRSQERLNVVGGFGTIDFINMGMRLSLNQFQLGLTIGTLFMGETSLSGDLYYHFAGKSNLTERRPWFIKSGFTYWHFKKDYELVKILSFGLVNNEEAIKTTFFNIGLGRDFNLTSKFGINGDVGLAFPINDKDMEITVAGNISFFYRL
jgi:hypothetical protein